MAAGAWQLRIAHGYLETVAPNHEGVVVVVAGAVLIGQKEVAAFLVAEEEAVAVERPAAGAEYWGHGSRQSQPQSQAMIGSGEYSFHS